MIQAIQLFFIQLILEIQDWRRLYFFRRPLLVVLALYCVALILLRNTGLFNRAGEQDPSLWTGQFCALTGVVSAHPDPRPSGTVYTLETETIEPFDGSYTRHSVQGATLLQVINSTTPFAAPGDRLRVKGRVQRPRPALTPGAFDYGEYLSDRGIHALLYTSENAVENLGDSGKRAFARWGWALKTRAAAIFRAHLTEQQSTVLEGLVVGNRPRFHPEIKKMFVESGTMHVLVASGSNVAFVVGFWFLLLRLARIPRRWALASALAPIWAYVLIVGADAPIVRAGLMGTIGILSYLLAREDRPYHPLGLAALCILIPFPRFLFDVGFQMSFLTVFGLVYFLSPFEEGIQILPGWSRWPARLLAASTTAQLWLAPLTAATFGRFFPVSLLSNILVVPLAGVGLTAGILLTLIDGAHVPRLDFLIRMYAQALINLVKFFSEHFGRSLWVAPPSGAFVAGFYLGCFSIVGWRSLAGRCGLGAGLLLMLFGLKGRDPHPVPGGSFSIAWIDTGKRLATIIESPEGKNILINPGPKEPYDSTERILMPFLTREKIRSLDAVLITNPLQSSGIDSLRQWVRVSTVVLCGSALVWIGDEREKILIAESLPLKTQDYLLAHPVKNISVIQTHFPQRFIWRPEFLRRYKPKILIETHTVSEFHPSVPPWPDVPLVAPQQIGWYRYSGRLEATPVRRG